jgi:hypothetical protein
MKKNTDETLVPHKEINLEANSQKNSCLVSRMQKNIQTLENMAQFKYLGTTLIHQDDMIEKIKSK